MSDTPLVRGQILFGQRRFDLADGEFRRGLIEDPDDPHLHALLALCHSELNRPEEARREADEAVRLGPDLPLSHYALARALCGRDQFREAEQAVSEAVRLDPHDADYRGQLAIIRMTRHHWQEALDAAEEGLALEPDHEACTNLRAMALVQLGRTAEASHALGSALANNPEDAFAHANRGWAFLHEGQPDEALVHFRESLRLDPQDEWARAGMIEALKAKHLIYRLMLRFFLWMGRHGRWTQVGFLLALVFGRQLLAAVATEAPVLAPVIGPVLTLTVAFLLLTWIASPLFNFLLFLNPMGRLALSRDQRLEAACIGGLALVAAIALGVQLAIRTSESMIILIYCGVMLLPSSVTFKQSPGRARTLMAAGTAAIALAGLPILSLLATGEQHALIAPQRALDLWQLFLYGAIGSTWIPALFSLRPR